MPTLSFDPSVKQPNSSAFVTITRRGGTLTARLAGPHIDERKAHIIATQLLSALSSQSKLKMLVLDLSEVAILSSLGLGMCVNARNRAAQHKAKTTLTGVNAELRSLLKMTKVDRLFHRVEREQNQLR